ncbi:MAG: hypothetical protein EOP23_08575 [Hyphomicrobiales bacterium]|nr:MAG: hypothetical protein EOP23_08575 [Hyphomicrobiales bacterium]
MNAFFADIGEFLHPPGIGFGETQQPSRWTLGQAHRLGNETKAKQLINAIMRNAAVCRKMRTTLVFFVARKG